MVRAVTFDYGGTLDGEASHWLDRFVELYAEAGLDLPFERVKEAFYRADDAAYGEPRIAEVGLAELMDFHVAVQLEVLGIDDATLRGVLRDRFVARSCRALAASRQILVRLAGRYRLGVISNFYGNVGRILAEEGLAPLLAAIVDSTAVGASKPDPRIFAHAVAELGALPEQILHVGDSYQRDVVAARAAGLRAAWLIGPQDGTPRPSDCAADYCVRSLAELAALLEAPGGGA